ncbi:MAG TPA: serpin family protein [Perlabentimonas sp.]|nr:serpin family protein [Bacteroidales bacterium]MDD4672822.1 serpin family protein [Bacteroidales bacterium]MDY0349189.1 serpin family protein [Tenuifilaceae bacterium]HZJ74885.1 serpin family protein [Perlabentimonas sp.]
MKTTTLTMACLLLLTTTNAQTSQYTASNANTFALEAYKQFADKDNKNIFFSPISINMAIGITYAGAKGETEEQMASVFNFPKNSRKFHKNMGALQKNIMGKASEKVEISLTNQLWADENYKFKCLYLRKAKKCYNAPVKNLDFYSHLNESRITINNWVEEQTKKRIKNLLPKGSLSKETEMVITNTIYFKGQWENQFIKTNTQNEDFTIIGGEKIKTPTMNATTKLNMYQGDDLKLIEIPYADKQFSMLVLLPDERTSLASIEKKLSIETLNHYTSLMTELDVRLALPKFKFDKSYKLKQTLSEMGMPLAFSNTADFTGMSKKKDLKIDEVFHKAFIEVSEEGTEAAAATAVVIVRKTSVISNEFRANRPFMFFIRENESGNILFLGRITNPQM